MLYTEDLADTDLTEAVDQEFKVCDGQTSNSTYRTQRIGTNPTFVSYAGQVDRLKRWVRDLLPLPYNERIEQLPRVQNTLDLYKLKYDLYKVAGCVESDE
jgi:hypothetical protein